MISKLMTDVATTFGKRLKFHNKKKSYKKTRADTKIQAIHMLNLMFVLAVKFVEIHWLFSPSFRLILHHHSIETFRNLYLAYAFFNYAKLFLTLSLLKSDDQTTLFFRFVEFSIRTHFMDGTIASDFCFEPL